MMSQLRRDKRPSNLIRVGRMLALGAALTLLASACSGTSGSAAPAPMTATTAAASGTTAGGGTNGSAAKSVAPSATASDPIPDSDATQVFKRTINVGGPLTFDNQIGDLQVMDIAKGKVDSRGQVPAAGYEFRSLWAQWYSKDNDNTGKVPSGMTWAITRNGVKIAGGDLVKTDVPNGSFMSPVDVNVTVSVSSPPVAGAGAGATLFALTYQGVPAWTLNLDTGAVVTT